MVHLSNGLDLKLAVLVLISDSSPGLVYTVSYFNIRLHFNMTVAEKNPVLIRCCEKCRRRTCDASNLSKKEHLGIQLTLTSVGSPPAAAARTQRTQQL
jgi:hypothetical protein